MIQTCEICGDPYCDLCDLGCVHGMRLCREDANECGACVAEREAEEA